MECTRNAHFISPELARVGADPYALITMLDRSFWYARAAFVPWTDTEWHLILKAVMAHRYEKVSVTSL